MMDTSKIKQQHENEFYEKLVKYGLKPKDSCPKCYGNGHTGYNLNLGKFMMCPKCIKKQMEEKIRENRYGKKNKSTE